MFFDFCDPDLDRVIERMLSKPYNGRVLFTHLPKMSPEDFPDEMTVMQKKLWFNHHDEYFATFSDDKQTNRIIIISVSFKTTKLCWRYQLKNKLLVDNLKSQISYSNENDNNNNISSGCDDKDCKLFHLCKGYVGQCCSGVDCELNHSLNGDEHNENILKHVDLQNKKSETILQILKLSQPQICQNYNRLGSCNYEDSCTRLHVCQDYAEGKCNKIHSSSTSGAAESTEATCPLSHSLTSTHSLRLLTTYNVGFKPENMISMWLHLLVEPIRNAPGYNNKKRNAHRVLNLFENANETGFSEFASVLLDASSSSTKLSSVEAFPIKWQVDFLDNWINFDDHVNHKIEVGYADPNINEVAVNIPFDITELISHCVKMTINFDNMEALLDDNEQKLKVQREEITDDQRTLYLWYYLKDNLWELLPEIDDVEMAYKNKQKRFKLMFNDSEHRIKFEDMTLRDLRKGDCFNLRRRPIW